ncbi:hypothetical protein ncot_12800 [Nocardioides sp. JQ2195]|nr:hypothetical protein [Nocardioides sp. JQ2195]QIX25146.1 hypothetical protein ncot_12800 [Nocardioides sp. JQ2195]
MSLTSLILAASETSSEPAVNPYVVGVITLAILLVSLLIVMAIGGGREHS